jgi:hypothetical protein
MEVKFSDEDWRMIYTHLEKAIDGYDLILNALDVDTRLYRHFEAQKTDCIMKRGRLAKEFGY